MSANARPVVLVVDDTAINLTVMENILNAEYAVKLAKSGQEALDAAFATPPDLILLDVMMPGIDGFEVCRRLKENPATRDVPVIFLTAQNEVKDEELGFSLGAADFIHKPISAPIVLARVKAHLKIKFMQDYLMGENARLKEDSAHNFAELDQLRKFLWGEPFVRR